MTSRNCLFNFKLFKKSLFQQKYVMLIHTIVLLLSTTLIAYLLYSNYSADRYTDGLADVAELICFRNPLIIFMIIGAGFVSAFFGFSHLYKRNSSVMFGAMPVKRSSMFVTKLSACLVSVILPVLLVLVVNIIAVNMMGLTVDAGELCARLGYILLQYILYTSIFSFAAVVSGNGFAQLITAGFICLVYPVTYLITAGVIDVALETWVANFNPDWGYMFPAAYIMDGEIAVRYYVFSAIVAICAIMAGFFLYIKRRNEKSGEFFGFSWVNALIKYYISVCTAMIAYLVTESALGDNSGFAPFVVGIVIGAVMFVVLRGIFEKSFKAMFSNPRYIAIYVGIVVLLLGSLEFDIFGLDKRVGEIERARISVFGIYVYDGIDNEYVIELDSPECVEAVRKVADARINGTDNEHNTRFVDVVINDNPFGFRRRFRVTEEMYDDFSETIYDSKEYKEECIGFIQKRYDDSLWRIYGNGIYDITGNKKEELWKILSEDIKNHSYSEIKSRGPYFYINFEPYKNGQYYGDIPVYKCFENTEKFIEDNYPSKAEKIKTEKIYD